MSVVFEDRVLRIIVLKRYTPVYRLGVGSTLSDFKVIFRDVFDCAYIPTDFYVNLGD
jgi:hypothetical protein